MVDRAFILDSQLAGHDAKVGRAALVVNIKNRPLSPPPLSRPGNCYDNAFIESFWSSLKYELVYHQRFATFTEARRAIFNYIETFYNRTRLHSSLAYQSPIQFESQLNLN